MQLVELAYQWWIVQTLEIHELEHSGRCAMHPDRPAKKRCRFCCALMCGAECAERHEYKCPNVELVPECFRSTFSLAKFAEKLAATFPAAPFNDSSILQRACDASGKLLMQL